MTYYLLLEGDTEKDVIYETNVLGEESFEVFYPSIGFILMNKIINGDSIKVLKKLEDNSVDLVIAFFLHSADSRRQTIFAAWPIAWLFDLAPQRVIMNDAP